MIQSFADITHAYYINLEERTDRCELVQQELSNIGLNATRFPAIKMENGAIGCTLSHLKLLENALKNNYSHILILEDDIQFLNPELFKSQINKFFSLHGNLWDVIIISGNNIPPYSIPDNTCIKVNRCQTTTGYLVNGHYIKKLHDNMKEGLRKLIEQPAMHFYYAVDKYWFHLQQQDRWYLIMPLSVVQREGYSDIEKRHTNYSLAMLDPDKQYLFKK